MEFDSGLLLIALLVVGVYLRWSEDKDWEIIYENSSIGMNKAQGRFAYLKANGVRCRMKTLTPRAANRAVNPAMQSTVRVLVHKKDLHKAYELLANYEER